MDTHLDTFSDSLHGGVSDSITILHSAGKVTHTLGQFTILEGFAVLMAMAPLDTQWKQFLVQSEWTTSG